MTNPIYVNEPTFPLTVEQFERALRTGHGRAKEQIFAYGASGISQALLDVVTQCPVFDSQCEDPRADWIVEMVVHAGLGQQAVNRIVDIQYQPTSEATFWNRDYRSSVLMELAGQSIPGAREELYRTLSREAGTDDIIAAEDIIELDGASGLEFVAGRLGEWLAEDSEFWVDDRLLIAFDEGMGVGAGRRILESASWRIPGIARYLSELDHSERKEHGSLKIPPLMADDGRQRHANRMKGISAKEVIEGVRSDSSDHFYWLRGWGRHAAPVDRENVFDALLEETEPRRIASFLNAFTMVSAPTFDTRFADWLKIEEAGVRRVAVHVLAHVSDPRVRELAIQLLEHSDNPHHFLLLLTSNFKKGDSRFIEGSLRVLSDENEQHWQLYDLLSVFEKNSLTECTTSVCFAYEHTPCSNCRFRAIKLLASIGTTPAWITEEAKLDGSGQIRAFVSGSH